LQFLFLDILEFRVQFDLLEDRILGRPLWKEDDLP
jgi:hypothetical protein